MVRKKSPKSERPVFRLNSFLAFGVTDPTRQQYLEDEKAIEVLKRTTSGIYKDSEGQKMKIEIIQYRVGELHTPTRIISFSEYKSLRKPRSI